MTGSFVVTGVPIRTRHDRPAVEALAVRDGVVAAAGDLADARAAVPPGTEELLLDHGAVMPAFIDAHQHAFLVAIDPHTDVLYRRGHDISGLLTELAALVAIASDQAGAAADTGPAVNEPSSPWLRFHGYEPLTLAEHRSPTAAELDTVCADRPLHVISRTYHESTVNSAGLAELGISNATPDPPGGRIVKDRRGRPTGVLLEAASFAAEAASRPTDPTGGWRARLADHGRRLTSLGIARIGDAAVPIEAADDMVEILRDVGIGVTPLLTGKRIDEPGIIPHGTAKVLADGGEYCHLCMTSRQVRTVMKTSTRASFGPERGLARAMGRRAGFPKREPDGAWHTGIRFPEEAALPQILRIAAQSGSGLAVHAIGNGAVEAVLSAVAADTGLAADVAVRVEHAMAIDTELIALLARHHLPVVAQPGFITAFGHELNLTPVPPPLQLMPFRTMLDAGIPLTFSSDYPAAELTPWAGVAAAVNRIDSHGLPVGPEQSVTVAEALTAYTTTAAETLGLTDAGTLEPGRRADLMWCDRDPHASEIGDLASIRVLGTWVDGRRVFDGR